jgi:DNA-binding NtrC family response regulator
MVIRLLEQGGYATTHARVETAEDMAAALGNAAWDIVLADYQLPALDAPHALEVLKEQQLDIPFIVISDEISEDTALEMLSIGAHACVQKDRPARLVEAVKRELHEAKLRREKVTGDAALLDSERRYRRLFESAKDGILILDAETGWSRM